VLTRPPACPDTGVSGGGTGGTGGGTGGGYTTPGVFNIKVAGRADAVCILVFKICRRPLKPLACVRPAAAWPLTSLHAPPWLKHGPTHACS
jgi:hypothetical protein